MATAHSQHYDPLKEMLLSIPCEPEYVLLPDLMGDIGIADRRKIKDLLKQANDFGVEVLMSKAKSRMNRVSIAKSSWIQNKVICERYWREVIEKNERKDINNPTPQFGASVSGIEVERAPLARGRKIIQQVISGSVLRNPGYGQVVDPASRHTSRSQGIGA